MFKSINIQGSGFKNFLPNAHCIGDFLKQNGYQNIFLQGINGKFAGTERFFKSHGYQETYSKEFWIKSGKYQEQDLGNWGLNDQDLLFEAKNKLDDLMLEKKLFNLTILTIDTHGTDGIGTKGCQPNNKFEDIIKCSADSIDDFIQHAKNKGYLENTNIVVIGDHLPSKNLRNKLDNDNIYNMWITNDSFKKYSDTFIAFDLTPSIIEFVGFKIDGGQYGLGYSAFSSHFPLTNQDRLDLMEKVNFQRSNSYFKLWKK